MVAARDAPVQRADRVAGDRLVPLIPKTAARAPAYLAGSNFDSSAWARANSTFSAASIGAASPSPCWRASSSIFSAPARKTIAPRLDELPLMLWAARVNFSTSPAARLCSKSAMRFGVSSRKMPTISERNAPPSPGSSDRRFSIDWGSMTGRSDMNEAVYIGCWQPGVQPTESGFLGIGCMPGVIARNQRIGATGHRFKGLAFGSWRRIASRCFDVVSLNLHALMLKLAASAADDLCSRPLPYGQI